jgi:hypothetical protein
MFLKTSLHVMYLRLLFLKAEKIHESSLLFNDIVKVADAGVDIVSFSIAYLFYSCMYF